MVHVKLTKLKSIVVSACAVLAATTGLAPVGNAIEGGYNSAFTPWTAKVLSAGLCTGSVIAPNWVLTANHCVDVNNPGSIKLGEHAQGNYRADRVVPHPSGADMALVHTADPLPVIPAALAPTLPAVGQLSQASGWGAGRFPLQQGVSRVQNYYTDHARGDSQMFTVRSVIGNQEPGDSGGPYHLGPVVFGVATAVGAKDANGKISTNYVAVAPMIPWIIATMAGVPQSSSELVPQVPTVQLPEQSSIPDIPGLGELSSLPQGSS